MTRVTSVPATYHGFAVQAWRCLYHLLRAEADESVSVEYLDDVSVHDGITERVLLEQCKATATNPISDRSPELWKTFANWVDACRSGEIDASKTLFTIHCDKKYKKANSIAARLHAAKTPRKVANAIEAIRTKFWGEAPSFPLKSTLPSSLAPHIDKVLEADRGPVKLCVNSIRRRLAFLPEFLPS